MFGRTTDGSSDNEAVKIANAFKPFWKKWTDEWGRSCVRTKKMTVTTAPSNGRIGVKDAFSDTEVFVKYNPDLYAATVGSVVWCKWMFGNMQTLVADSYVDPSQIPAYLPRDGGKLTGNVTIQKSSGGSGFYVERTDTGTSVSLHVGSGGTNHGLSSISGNKWIIYNDANGNTFLPEVPTVGGHTSPIGTILTANLSSDKSISTATGTAVVSLNLPVGTWVLTGRVRFSANANGFRQINITNTSGSNASNVRTVPVPDSVTQMSMTRIVSVESSATTYYLNAYQNSGSSLTLTAGSNGEINALVAVRIA